MPSRKFQPLNQKKLLPDDDEATNTVVDLPPHLKELIKLLPLDTPVHRSVLEARYGRSNYARRIRKIVSEYGWQIERERRSTGANDDWYTRRSDGPVRAQRIRKEVSPRARLDIYERDGWKCQMCGCDVGKNQTETQPQCDHKIPTERDGRTIPENLQTLCTRCNLKKRQACHYCSLPSCSNCPYAFPELFATTQPIILSAESAAKLDMLSRQEGVPPITIIERLIRSAGS